VPLSGKALVSRRVFGNFGSVVMKNEVRLKES